MIELFFQEASFENDAATFDFAVNFFGIVGEAYALDFSATLDNHR